MPAVDRPKARKAKAGRIRVALRAGSDWRACAAPRCSCKGTATCARWSAVTAWPTTMLSGRRDFSRQMDPEGTRSREGAPWACLRHAARTHIEGWVRSRPCFDIYRVSGIVRQRHLSGKKKLGQKGHHLWVNLKHTSGKKQKHKKKMLTGESNYRVQ